MIGGLREECLSSPDNADIGSGAVRQVVITKSEKEWACMQAILQCWYIDTMLKKPGGGSKYISVALRMRTETFFWSSLTKKELKFEQIEFSASLPLPFICGYWHVGSMSIL